MRTGTVIGAGILATVLAVGVGPAVRADEAPDPRFEETPPRLSLIDGQVSFWRPGAPDWTQAQLNTPLAPGDALSTGSPGTLEIQVGARAFARAWANTQLALGAHDPSFLQLTLAAGSVVIDLRALDPGDTVEIDTPNAAVVIQQAGYYRVDVTGARSRVMTRGGGRAAVTPAGGQPVAVTPSEELVVEGTAGPQLAAYAAPPLDDWDRWNYARTDGLLDAVSARYVTPGTYGLSDLDPYGTWRVVPTYGTVWVPTSVPAGWTPYSAGSWILDPVYGWTWVDAAPWGWAPYHHGRWGYVDGYWAWVPGPVLARPVYAPALVAFLGEPGGVVVGPGGPPVGWVALGWGEPVIPWWGPRGVPRAPSWRGWGGPRVVNNVVVTNTTVINAPSITGYRNAIVPHGVVAVDRERFGHGPVTGRRIVQVDPQRLRPMPGAPEVSAPSVVPTARRGVRPPEAALKRLEIAPERLRREREATTATPTGPAVTKSELREPVGPLPRPSFGHGTPERPMVDRRTLPGPPRAHASPPVMPATSSPPRNEGAKTPAGPPLQPAPRPALAPAPGPTGPPPSIRSGPGPSVARPTPVSPDLTRAHGSPSPAIRAIPVAPGGPARAKAPAPSGAGSPAATAYPGGGHSNPATVRSGAARPPTHPLPGEPASRMAPGRGPRGPGRPDQSQGQSK